MGPVFFSRYGLERSFLLHDALRYWQSCLHSTDSGTSSCDGNTQETSQSSKAMQIVLPNTTVDTSPHCNNGNRVMRMAESSLIKRTRCCRINAIASLKLPTSVESRGCRACCIMTSATPPTAMVTRLVVIKALAYIYRAEFASVNSGHCIVGNAFKPIRRSARLGKQREIIATC